METLQTEPRELEYQAYQKRQYAEVSSEALHFRAAKLSKGGRARWDGTGWSPLPYPGYAMQAMLESSPNNAALLPELVYLQYEIISILDRPGTLYPLPAASFHQTVANTFSADRLQRHLIDKDKFEAFPEMVKNAISSFPATSEDQPVKMRLIGASLFRTAIGVLGVFENSKHFERIIAFRDQFYRQPELSALGLRRTRPFIGHVTLAYLEADLEESEQTLLAEGIAKLNTRLGKRSLVMEMPQAELRRYDTLSAFISEPHYPTATL